MLYWALLMGTQIIYMHKIIKKVQTYNVIIL